MHPYNAEPSEMPELNVAAINDLANRFLQTGRHREALTLYRQAMRLDPHCAAVRRNLAAAWSHLDRPRSAARQFARACKLDPAHPHAWQRLALVLRSLDQMAEAQAAATRATELQPGNHHAWLLLAQLLLETDDFDRAIAALDRSITLDPNWAPTHSTLGVAYRMLGDEHMALASHRQALQLAPTWAAAHLELAETLLSFGHLQEGWNEYRWRHQALGHSAGGNDASPESCIEQGEPPALIHAEQGLGTQIMFASCLTSLSASWQGSIVTCDPRLVGLLQRSFADLTIRSDEGQPNARDLGTLHSTRTMYLGDLAEWLRPSFDRFARQGGCLAADSVSLRCWKTKLQMLPGQRRIAISWRGGKSPDAKRRRSVPLDAWSPILRQTSASFVSVQHGFDGEVVELSAGHQGVYRWSDLELANDIDSLAGLLAAVDLVITVDNTVAHLAGALGVPTWVLLPAASDWRWFVERCDSPWYPSVRLFRQSSPGTWAPVIEEVAAALADYLAAASGESRSQQPEWRRRAA